MKGSDEVAEIGWIKLHRKIQDCWIWQEKPYDKARAWVDLLLLALHHDKKLLIDNEIFVVERGSFMTSILKLSDRWGWSRNKVKRFLELLEDEQMLNTKRTPKGTLVTIVKYEDYQPLDTSGEPTIEPTNEPINRPTGEPTLEPTDEPQNKNIKNDKNIKNNNIRRNFKPPTLQEVQEYCQERNNKVDAQSFVDFYESKDWMVGKNKMKDWKASVRTWERREKNKPSQTNPRNPSGGFNDFKQRDYDYDELEKKLLGM